MIGEPTAAVPLTIGICTRYDHHEATYAAIRLAEWAREHGRPVSLYTFSAKKVAVDPRWDNEVVRGVPLTEWVESVGHVFWTTPPSVEQAVWLRRRGRRISVLLILHELSLKALRAFPLCDHLLLPHRSFFRTVASAGAEQVVLLPWDAGGPIFEKPAGYEIDQLKLLVPLWDGNCRRVRDGLFDVLEHVICTYRGLQVTFAYSSSTLPGKYWRRVKRLQRKHPGSVQLAKRLDLQDRMRLFRQHDLTVWGSCYESLGLVGLTSLAMGTPVLGFNFDPVNEILQKDNSLLLPCTSPVVSHTGMVAAVPNYPLLDDVLYDLARNPVPVQNLFQGVTESAVTRKRRFDQMMCQIVS